MSTLLITGATGFLGSHLVHALLGAGHQVKALRRSSSSLDRVHDVASDVVWLNIDDNPSALESFLAGVDCVMHAAASYGRSGESVVDIVQANTLFGLSVLNAALKQNVKIFINTDSSLPKTTNAYTLSKAHLAEWGKFMCSEMGTHFINIRLEHMYGPGDDPVKFTDHVIATCLRNEPELKLTAGLQQRDFIYIDDVVSAYLLLMETQPITASGYAEVSLGSGEVISVRNLVETIHSMTRSTTHLAFGAVPTKLNEVLYSCADTSQLRQLGWQPETSLIDGLRQTIKSKQA